MRMFTCKLLGFTDCIGAPIERIPLSGVIKARVEMGEDHDERGGAKGEVTITSALRSIDFERRLIVTQNNVYQF
ncbi:hypothetical protein [Bradyrhizobium elkanii]|jgi:ssDNA-binding replication factor A large subunit|uniref:Uncharacterized protein n=2 Tax=Bradyrhizobium TaxID=374 RepID=A0A810CS48_9BRAD|nr:hypothetical protein [Bradyrhizobium elkanii]BCE22145.1 hypothetical protein XF1B_48260 [Bradyrhizobium diazoefficiens]MCS3577290.1 ssDNA-binding replication factor A large subunit [Bradyrhizobium elkanii]MCS3720167.1 ssDNA-binding replication factor A large subunit [Bradyrhizobium elkanii]MCS3881109.1 ssDNA-binding replication factor A large subunit [Bradyrhizobium elkanii]MCS4004584.1 ssDNA-binding replication factor A large subunit [Bradyrhizobium elkanii USDA 61]